MDEDVPGQLADHLSARGIEATTVKAIRASLGLSQGQFEDDEVCEAIARQDSVLVTLNIRDYADHEFLVAIAEKYQISAVIVRIPKTEQRAGSSAKAIHDIVHRHAHKIAKMHHGEPVIASANRRGMRQRLVSEIVRERDGETAGRTVAPKPVPAVEAG
ncbi:MAG TPA: DUF5615 family PIN-like protein [Fimbriimonadaceae bacterium]|nr:DUF5615 family PIN-like protein [Fimbriimonadaceae bacterium]HVM36586.1 DUF5615 family PIN-like protein [Actinomycetota bacterium]